MAGTSDDFESAQPDYRRPEPEQLSLFLMLDGYEGPIDVLLSLSRDRSLSVIVLLGVSTN